MISEPSLEIKWPLNREVVCKFPYVFTYLTEEIRQTGWAVKVKVSSFLVDCRRLGVIRTKLKGRTTS